MYEELLKLDEVEIHFSAEGMHVVNFILAFVMFGVALGIKPQMFKNVFLYPKSVILGLFCQWIALPAVTFFLVVVFNRYITPMVAMGMLLVAACPGGNMSNFMSHLSKGNTELSISLTAITTAFSTIVTPFNFALWGGFYVKFINKHAENALQTLHIDTFQMFETVFLLLGIPIVLGFLVVRFLPKVAEKVKKPMQYLSIVFFMVMIAVAFSNNLDVFLRHIFYIFILVFIHNFLALSTGFGIATIFNVPAIDRRSLAIETGIQNSGLGLVLLFNPKIFPPEMAMGGMLLVTAWWGIWHIISGLSVSLYWSRHPVK
ncbi:MAG: bile acid:sodium symporter family protein [Bacteroidales bacterium]|jgi:BASS family bile acid:Na+ symporter|nr:bile acid:sodium symporter family protein [Bacteroidales bacterium]